MESTFFDVLAKAGPMGAAAAFAGWMWLQKDKQLVALYDKYIERLAANSDRYHEATTSMREAITALAQAVRDHELE